MPLRLTGAAGSGTILKSTFRHAPDQLVRPRKRGAAAEDEHERRGIDRRDRRYRLDDIEILLDQADARQPEMFLDFPERALRIIAQAAAPYPDTADDARSGLSPARPD